MLDLIGLLAAGEISADEAEAEFDRVLRADRAGEIADFVDYLGMSNLEATAHAHGATFEALAELRNEGWPDRCCRCGELLDVDVGGWMFRYGTDESPRLMHLECPRPPLDRPLCEVLGAED